MSQCKTIMNAFMLLFVVVTVCRYFDFVFRCSAVSTTEIHLVSCTECRQFNTASYVICQN
jgi:hypothetical protein